LLHTQTAANLASDPWSTSADSSSSARGLLSTNANTNTTASAAAAASTAITAGSAGGVSGDVRAGMRGQPTELALLVAAAKVTTQTS
jgi:hypothetical protein